MLVTDVERYSYEGLHGLHAECRLRLYEHEGKKILVATELEDNPGTSITNMAEWLAGQAYRDLVEQGPMVWIEHYPCRCAGRKRDRHDSITCETFDLVTFSYDVPLRQLVRRKWMHTMGKPNWKHITAAEAEAIVGERLRTREYDNEPVVG